jgi:hypothetical protein
VISMDYQFPKINPVELIWIAVRLFLRLMILSRVDRAKDYGDAHQNFLNISKGWSVIFGVNVAPEKVALAMDWLKTCRLIN